MSGCVKKFVVLFVIIAFVASLLVVSLVSCNPVGDYSGSNQDGTGIVANNSSNNNQTTNTDNKNPNKDNLDNNDMFGTDTNDSDNSDTDNKIDTDDNPSLGDKTDTDDNANVGDKTDNDNNTNVGGNTDNDNNANVDDKTDNDNNTNVGDKTDDNSVVEMDFSKLDARFAEVVAPIKEAAKYILNDLIERGLVDMADCPNYCITSLRYCYGSSLWITYQFDVHIFEDIFAVDGEKSEFLICEETVELEGFTESYYDRYSDSYLAYRKFLWELKRYGDLQNVDAVKDMAKTVADNMLSDYGNYDKFEDIEILNFGKHIILSQDCRYLGVYDKIMQMLNEALATKQNDSYPYNYFDPTFGYAPIDGDDIRIDFGRFRERKDNGSETIHYYVIFVVTKAMFEYNFKVELDEKLCDVWRWMYTFTGSPEPGYTPKNPNWFNPPNEEYEDFFDELLKLDFDFENAVFDSLSTEDTWLNF